VLFKFPSYFYECVVTTVDKYDEVSVVIWWNGHFSGRYSVQL